MPIPVLAASSLALPKISYLSILPVLVMLGGALVIVGGSSLTRRPMDRVWATSLAVLTSFSALVLSLFQWYDVARHGSHVTIAGAVVQDGFSAVVSLLVAGATFTALLVADGWLDREGVTGPELPVLLLVSASGAMVMAIANDLIVVFLGLEILSIALYVLAAMNRRRAESGEAALKYFVLGGFSSAVFLYGIALVYGATGTTNLPQIADFLARNLIIHNAMLLAGLALLLVGFGFKVAAVPFHLWTPDVYQGAPTPVTGFMASVSKVGAFAALLRIFVSSFGILRLDWQPVVWGLAAATLLVGAVVALLQRDIKRMLAYSSINHAGFILLGLQAADGRGVSAALFYLFVYSFMVLGAFAVVSVVGGPGDWGHDLQRYRGLSRSQPWLALMLAVFLVAQAGAPFTTGFWAKFEVVTAAVAAHSWPLAIIAMVSAAIAAFFYLRVIVLMYSPSGPVGDAPEPADRVVVDTVAEGGPEATATAAPGVLGSRDLPDLVQPAVETADLSHEAELPAGTVALAVSPDEHREPGGDDGAVASLHIPGNTGLAIAICLGVTVVFGFFPGLLGDMTNAATLLFGGR